MTYQAATFELRSPDRVARWRPLVAWLLAFPHYLVLYGLGIVSGAVAVISWFAIVFTGKLPAGLAGLQVLYVRYQERATLYAAFLYEEYPPFAFPTDPVDPGDTRVTVSYRPEFEDRNRLTVFFRIILGIPLVIWVMLVWLVASFVIFLAFFAVIILGRWPQWMRDFVVKATRLSVQYNAYLLLLTDTYPPFGFTPDGSPTATPPPPPPPPSSPSDVPPPPPPTS